MPPSILLIDNYDSFVFNLDRYLQELGVETIVRRNDELTLEGVRRLAPAAIVISPGPCTPNEAGVSMDLVREFYQTIPILGVCLGHQAIAQALGGTIIRAPEPYHGRTSLVRHDEKQLFTGCPNPLTICRYHSLIVEETTLPVEFEITSRTLDRMIMSIEHKMYPVFGVQFHPESVLTNSGHRLLKNFLNCAGISSDNRLEELGDLPEPVQFSDDFYQRHIDGNAWRPL